MTARSVILVSSAKQPIMMPLPIFRIFRVVIFPSNDDAMTCALGDFLPFEYVHPIPAEGLVLEEKVEWTPGGS